MVTVNLFCYILLVFKGGGHYRMTIGSETSKNVWTWIGDFFVTFILCKNCLSFVLACSHFSFFCFPSLCTWVVVGRHSREFLQHTVKPNGMWAGSAAYCFCTAVSLVEKNGWERLKAAKKKEMLRPLTWVLGPLVPLCNVPKNWRRYTSSMAGAGTHKHILW